MSPLLDYPSTPLQCLAHYATQQSALSKILGFPPNKYIFTSHIRPQNLLTGGNGASHSLSRAKTRGSLAQLAGLTSLPAQGLRQHRQKAQDASTLRRLAVRQSRSEAGGLCQSAVDWSSSSRVRVGRSRRTRCHTHPAVTDTHLHPGPGSPDWSVGRLLDGTDEFFLGTAQAERYGMRVPNWMAKVSDFRTAGRSEPTGAFGVVRCWGFKSSFWPWIVQV